MPLPLRYYMFSPSLLRWAVARFPGAACLAPLLAEGGGWHPDGGKGDIRTYAAWALCRRMAVTPCLPLPLDDAFRVARAFRELGKTVYPANKRARYRKGGVVYTPEHHQWYKLVGYVESPLPALFPSESADRRLFQQVAPEEELPDQ